MKQTEKISIFLMTFFLSAFAFAQDKAADLTVDVNSTKSTTSTEWYGNPIYWVVGAVALIIIIALITRGNNNNSN
ncbi:hypothetical protein [Halpernia frigidisoli]|nr:hypothetical protein [Halpernia frigidisoli]